MKSELELLKRKLAREQQARKEAEELLEKKALELYRSNQELVSLNKQLEKDAKIRALKLQKTETEYEFLIESINDMIFRLDLNANVVFANTVVVKILGLEKKDLIGKNIFDLLPPKSSRGLKYFIGKQFLSRNCISYFELKIKNQFGKDVWLGLNIHFSSNQCKQCVQKQQALVNITQAVKAGKNCNFSEVIVVAHDITLQKSAQFNLSKSEKRYRELIEFLPEMICEVDDNGILTYVNQYAIDKFGYTTEEVVNTNFDIYKIFPENARPQIHDDIEIVYKKRKTISGEFKAITKTGDIFSVLAYFSPIYENNLVVGIRGVMLDITERKLYEKEIAQNLKQQEILSQISLNYNTIEDFDKTTNEVLRVIGHYHNVSRVYIFESSENNTVISNTFEWCNEGIEPQINELQNIPYSEVPSLKSMLEKNNMIYSEDIRELPPDLYAILAPQKIKSIVILPLVCSEIYGFIGFDECTTSRKWRPSEIELLRTISNIISNAYQRNNIQSELIKSESENRIIVNSIPDVILKIGSDGSIKSLKTAQNFQLFARFKNDHDTLHSVFNEKLARSMMDALRKCFSLGAYQFDFQHVVLDSIEYYEARMIRLTKSEILVIVRNVTELREKEEQLRIAKNKAEEASKSKSEFLANVSHEIRTPLNAILGFSQWLLENTQITQHKMYLNTILSSGKNLLSLINDILDLSKLEAGRVDIDLQPMNYNEVVNDIKMVFLQKVEEKGLSFKITTDSSVPDFIYMDELRFYQIIFNLISNAIKFTSKGYVHVSAFAMKSGTKDTINLNIVVEDTGIGIREDQQELIFDSFTQQSGQSNRNFEGTGLGLAIVNGLLKKLNGTISLKSAPGKGSVFTLVFNGVKVDTSEHNQQSAREEKTSIKLDPCKIMIVDDIPFNVVVLKKLIDSKEATYIEAENGADALAKLNNEKPDIIFMDIRMPGMSGFDVAEVIKNEKKWQNIPIVAFTASTIKQKDDQIDQLFDDYLQKPVFKKDLDAILKKFLMHEIVEVKTEPEIVQVEVEPVESSSEQVPLEVVNELNEVHMETWQNIKDNLVIYEIEAFCKKLSELAFQKSCKILTKYCDELNIGLQTFDIEIIAKKLNEFPEIVQRINASL